MGRLNVRKNLDAVLLGALDSGRLTTARPLIVVGSEDGMSVDLPSKVAEATRRGLIRFVPHVTDGELSWLYAHADVFVYLALDEGFGLPPVEALHFGTPVVVSDIAVFHENLGSFATYVDPHDTAAVARTLRGISTDRVDAAPVLRSWAGCARRLRAAIEDARA